mgnify:CR=1 FL=1
MSLHPLWEEVLEVRGGATAPRAPLHAAAFSPNDASSSAGECLCICVCARCVCAARACVALLDGRALSHRSARVSGSAVMAGWLAAAEAA